MRSGRLSLRNLTEHLRTCGDLNYSFRDREVQAVQECMIREENASCVLLGKAGVGKTALAFKFIQEAAKGQVPPMLKAMIFYELRLEDLLASTKFVGDSERAIKELLNRPGILALFIDEIHRLISPQLSPVADAIKPEMASGKVRIIGASTHDEWRQVQDKALKRRLVPIEVGEPNAQETFLMIRPRVSRLKEHYGIQFTDEVIKTAICLGKLYLSDLSFPAKAIDILDRAAAAQTVQKYSCSKRY
jgi:ATP-dependent Clp protease ATP-binding subunit ClpA